MGGPAITPPTRVRMPRTSWPSPLRCALLRQQAPARSADAPPAGPVAWTGLKNAQRVARPLRRLAPSRPGEGQERGSLRRGLALGDECALHPLHQDGGPSNVLLGAGACPSTGSLVCPHSQLYIAPLPIRSHTSPFCRLSQLVRANFTSRSPSPVARHPLCTSRCCATGGRLAWHSALSARGPEACMAAMPQGCGGSVRCISSMQPAYAADRGGQSLPPCAQRRARLLAHQSSHPRGCAGAAAAACPGRRGRPGSTPQPAGLADSIQPHAKPLSVGSKQQLMIYVPGRINAAPLRPAPAAHQAGRKWSPHHQSPELPGCRARPRLPHSAGRAQGPMEGTVSHSHAYPCHVPPRTCRQQLQRARGHAIERHCIVTETCITFHPEQPRDVRGHLLICRVYKSLGAYES
jgi:hypothetical protein